MAPGGLPGEPARSPCCCSTALRVPRAPGVFRAAWWSYLLECVKEVVEQLPAVEYKVSPSRKKRCETIAARKQAGVRTWGEK